MMSPKDYTAFYLELLQSDLMPFWEKRCVDGAFGGYLTCFDRAGNLTDDSKYVWFQGRMLSTFSAYYRTIEKSEKWLRLAEHGYRFMLDKCYGGRGRWNYRLNRAGDVTDGTISIYSDGIAIQSLSEYLLATDRSDPEGMEILTQTYDVFEANMLDPDFKEIYENTWSPTYTWNDLYLAALNAANCAGRILPAEKVRPLQEKALDMILYRFAQDRYKMLFEAIPKSGESDWSDPVGRFINPGHAMESCWMCLEALNGREDARRKARVLEIVDWTYAIGYDREYGGMFAYLDARGEEPTPLDWHKEANVLWDDKVFWVNAESLRGFAAAYSQSGDLKYLRIFENLHRFCERYFHDRIYGEWYERLRRDGTVKVGDKGTRSKCAGHVERSAMALVDMFRNLDA